MISFYINPSTGDIELDGQNDIRMVRGDAELVQCVSVALKTNKGEWFLNPDHGFERDIIQGKKYNAAEAEDAISEAVLQEPRVSSMRDVSFKFDASERRLEASFKFLKENGDLVEGAI